MSTSWLASAAPDAAIEIAPEGVAVAVLGSRGADAVVQAWGAAPLAPGAIVPSLASSNIADRAAVAEALRGACDRAGHRPRRAALIVPDLAARVSLVRFDHVPARREDLDQLIRWQVKKAFPFPVDEACVTYSPGARGEFLVVAARRDVVREYEGICDEAGIHAGIVDLSTLSVVNLYMASGAVPAGDWLVVHIRPGYTSIAIVRGEDVIFFRTRPDDDTEPLSDVVHQTAMYYQDRLDGRGFARVFAGGFSRTPSGVELAIRELAARLEHPVDALDPTQAAALARGVAAAPDERAALAPLVGMLLRTRREAVSA